MEIPDGTIRRLIAVLEVHAPTDQGAKQMLNELNYYINYQPDPHFANKTWRSP